jgi:methylthioribose-1-phosphate isomerase
MSTAVLPATPSVGRPQDAVRYDAGVVWILDRRAYPFSKTYVRCETLEEVASAIRSMVTQSMGPGPTAGYAMALTARAGRNNGADRQVADLREAAERLVATRPTNDSIRLMTARLITVAESAVAVGEDVEKAILGEMEVYWVDLAVRLARVGATGAGLIHADDVVLTHCWPDAPLMAILEATLARGVRFSMICTETRPYLQGARLTADAVASLGIDTTVVTDGMPAHLMASDRVSTFMAGADRITMDGHWVNKVGTLAIAIAARRYGVPAYGLGFRPDPHALTASDVEIEIRDPAEALSCLGIRTATYLARGYYPAFDITPPDLVTAFVTDRGLFAPDRLASYFGG